MADRTRPPGHLRRATTAAPAAPSGATGGASRSALAGAREALEHQHYVLRLYVTGVTSSSRQAIERVRRVCDEHLAGRYKLEVIDIYQLPALAKDEQIVATPTLIKVLPVPLRRFIGNLSNVEKVLFGLDLRERP